MAAKLRSFPATNIYFPGDKKNIPITANRRKPEHYPKQSIFICLASDGHLTINFIILERFLFLLKSYEMMPLELEQTLLENVQAITVRKGRIVQPFGSLVDSLFFVERGLFNEFFIDSKVERLPLRFAAEDEWINSGKLVTQDFFSDGASLMTAGKKHFTLRDLSSSILS